MAQEALGGEYTLLFNGIEIERFAKAPPWVDADPHRGTDGPTIFFVGRHEPRKGLDVLLASLRYLPADVRVWVGGDGPETAALRSHHTGDPRIEWLGRISDEEKASRMRGADVFCAPSLRGESFGVVLLEAMAAGTPVVASDLDGYRNVARSGADGLLVPPGDPRALATALGEVLSNPSCAEALGDVGSAAGRGVLDGQPGAALRRPLPAPLAQNTTGGACWSRPLLVVLPPLLRTVDCDGLRGASVALCGCVDTVRQIRRGGNGAIGGFSDGPRGLVTGDRRRRSPDGTGRDRPFGRPADHYHEAP